MNFSEKQKLAVFFPIKLLNFYFGMRFRPFYRDLFFFSSLIKTFPKKYKFFKTLLKVHLKLNISILINKT